MLAGKECDKGKIFGTEGAKTFFITRGDEIGGGRKGTIRRAKRRRVKRGVNSSGGKEQPIAIGRRAQSREYLLFWQEGPSDLERGKKGGQEKRDCLTGKYAEEGVLTSLQGRLHNPRRGKESSKMSKGSDHGEATKEKGFPYVQRNTYT